MSTISVTEYSLMKMKVRSFSTDIPSKESTYNNITDNRNESLKPETTEIRKSPTIFVLFEKKLLSSTLIYMTIWFCLSFGSYGISTWITVLFDDVGIGNVYASAFIFALANLPGNIVSILYVEQIGRRKLLFYGMLLAGLSTVGFALGTSVPAVVVISATLFNAFSVAGW
jgi:hypothetical protein